MRLSDLTPSQSQWLADDLGKLDDHLSAVLDRMRARSWDVSDHAYLSIVAASAALKVAAASAVRPVLPPLKLAQNDDKGDEWGEVTHFAAPPWDKFGAKHRVDRHVHPPPLYVRGDQST